MNPLAGLPEVVKNLLIINVLMLLATFVAYQANVNLPEILGLHHWSSDAFRPHQIITYMFMHGGLMHLFFNMFALYMFGRVLEQVWGAKRFLIYYIVCGIGAGLIQLLVNEIRIQALVSQLSPEDYQTILREGGDLIRTGRNYVDENARTLNALINTTTVGASGSVFGILLAFGMLFPNVQLMLIFPPIPLKAKYFVAIYGALELYLGIANNAGDNVAHFAHLGGMLFGFFMIRFWRKNTNNFY
ncbi:MAG: rhomboid family intramembrane serine protease [Flavobacteriales bacterium]|nr:rhomboid family intramembrane serine protease [Flavobacteriales bacterium]